MKNKVMLIACALFLGAFSVSAQLTVQGTGARNPDDLQRQVELFNGCQSRVVSFGGTAATQLITSGRGVLAQVEMVSTSESGAPTAPWGIEFFDAASLSDVTLATTSLGNANKIIANQFGIPTLSGASLGGAYTTLSQASVRNNLIQKPVQFNNGIVIRNSTAATNCQITIYWIK